MPKDNMPNGKEPKIMTEPLPDILNELETWHNENKDLIEELRAALKASQEAAQASQEAAVVAGQKADEAKVAGQEAAAAARKAAEAAVARIERAAMDEIQALKTGLQEALKVANNALALAQAMNLGIADASKSYNQQIEKL